MIKILKILHIVQEISNKDREHLLGNGYATAIRINPFNPLSYVTLILMFIIGIIMFGVVGLRKEINYENPFKWH